MPDQYVILQTAPLNNSSFVVVHSTVPPGNNQAGTPWTTALVEYKGGAPITSLVPTSLLSTGIQDQLDNGTRYEWSFTGTYGANDPSTGKRDQLESQLAAQSTGMRDDLQDTLRWWGQTGSV